LILELFPLASFFLWSLFLPIIFVKSSGFKSPDAGIYPRWGDDGLLPA
jgi:hypothetical protein